MKQHRQSTGAMALMTVAALMVTAWASSAVADGLAQSVLDLAKQGFIFEVFQTEKGSQEHQGAIIAVLLTRIDPEVKHGLVFLQTAEPVMGQGMVCALSEPLPNDGALRCSQKVGKYTETLTIGAIDSAFCETLRRNIDGNADRHTPDGKNPVAKPGECKNKYSKGGCVCYEIEDDKPDFPPNSGSGTGGHN